FNCFKVLNKIDCKLLLPEDILALTCSFKPIITKMTNRKHSTFIMTFFDEAVKAKWDHQDVLTKILSVYHQIFSELPVYRSLILKSVRTIFQMSSALISCETMLEQLGLMLNLLTQHLREVDQWEDNELVEIIV